MPTPPASWSEKRLLPIAEWFAENAYIAPGKNRLMTATGLMVGLMAGRAVMDILVGMDKNGVKTDKNHLPQPLQPFHGLLGYNKFEDSTSTKWHKVFDHTAPMLFGAFGAMAGSNYFFQHSHRVAPKLLAEMQEGFKGFYLQHASYTSEMIQSKYFNRLGGATFTLSAKSGTHLGGPLSPTINALRFQLGAGKKSMMPGLYKLTGNRGTQSTNLYQSLLDMIEWTEHNIAHFGGSEWYEVNGAITKKAKNALQNFTDVSPEQIKEFEAYIKETVETLEKVAERVKREHGNVIGDELVKHLRADPEFKQNLTHAFWADGLEKRYADMGLLDVQDPSKSKILYGDNGIITKLAKVIGSKKEMSEVAEYFEQAVKVRHGHMDATTAAKPRNLKLFDESSSYAAGALGLGGVGLLGYLGSKHKEPEISDEQKEQLRHNLPRHEAAEKYHEMQGSGRGHGVTGVINNTFLDPASWLSEMFVVPPSLHRFMNAAFLSTFLMGGMHLSNALAGRGLKGEALAKTDIWKPLQPLYKQMDYAWKSGHASDRWRYVAHQFLPVTVGALGTYTGSRAFFGERIQKTNQAEYLEEYTDKISMDESEAYAKASGVTSVLNTGSGHHLLPFVSYSSNLQNRFLMANGLQVASPGIGKWWSANPSKYPYHINKLLDKMIQYAVENTSEYPREFEPMAHAFVAKLYPQLSPTDQKRAEEAFVDEIYAVRDRYWQEGGIPDNKKGDCTYEFKQHFKREGLEFTMLKIGLDPRDAKLDNNGVGGKFARVLGANASVNRDIAAYEEKFTKRMHNYQTPDTRIPHPAEDLILADRLSEKTTQIH